MDCGDVMLIYVASGIPEQVVQDVFDVPNFNHIVDGSVSWFIHN